MTVSYINSEINACIYIIAKPWPLAKMRNLINAIAQVYEGKSLLKIQMQVFMIAKLICDFRRLALIKINHRNNFWIHTLCLVHILHKYIGERQADLAAKRLQQYGYTYTRLVSSRMTRAKDTACVIKETINEIQHEETYLLLNRGRTYKTGTARRWLEPE